MGTFYITGRYLSVAGKGHMNNFINRIININPVTHSLPKALSPEGLWDCPPSWKGRMNKFINRFFNIKIKQNKTNQLINGGFKNG